MRKSSVKQSRPYKNALIGENSFAKRNLFPKKHRIRKNYFYLDFFHKNG